MKVNVNNEYDKLQKVIVASANYYDSTSLAMNNETIKHYAAKENIPKKEIILEEQKKFWDTLKENNIDILIADQVEDAKGQMFTRDLAFVIGNKFFISNMRKENRKAAIKGWNHIINTIDKENIIKVPEDIYLEGGDVSKEPYVGDGKHINSDFLNGLNKEDAIEKMTNWLEEKKIGQVEIFRELCMEKEK